MNQVEIREINYGLPSKEAEGKNRLSFVETIHPSGIIQRLTVAERMGTRIFRSEHYRLQDGKEVLARERLIWIDIKTGKPDLRKWSVFSNPSGGLYFEQEERFNSGVRLHKSVTLCGGDSSLRYNREEYFDWRTGKPTRTEVSWPRMLPGSVCLEVRNFYTDGAVASEEKWTQVGPGIYRDQVSGNDMRLPINFNQGLFC